MGAEGVGGRRMRGGGGGGVQRLTTSHLSACRTHTSASEDIVVDIHFRKFNRMPANDFLIKISYARKLVFVLMLYFVSAGVF